MTLDTDPTNHEPDYFQSNHPYIPIIQLMKDFLLDKEINWQTLDGMAEDETLIAKISELESVDPTLFDRTRVDAASSRRPVTTFLEYVQRELGFIAAETYFQNGQSSEWEPLIALDAQPVGKIESLRLDASPGDVKKLLDIAQIILPKSKKRRNLKDTTIVYVIPNDSEQEVLDKVKMLFENQ